MTTLVSQFFRIGTAGPTIDGREILPSDITEMAETYDPTEYTALINSEHFMGLSPYSGFPALGEVTALQADTDDKGRVVLMAQIKPTLALLSINERGQKLFPSMEVMPNFAGTGKAYLSGLAMTDQPASLGTQAIQYSAQNGGPVPAKLKSHLYSQTFETDSFAMTDAPKDTPKTPGDNATGDAVDDAGKAGDKTFAQKFAAIFQPKQTHSDEKFAAIEKASLTLAEKLSEIDQTVKELSATVKTQADTIVELSAAQEQTPANGSPRPLATGNDATLTDC